MLKKNNINKCVLKQFTYLLKNKTIKQIKFIKHLNKSYLNVRLHTFCLHILTRK